MRLTTIGAAGLMAAATLTGCAPGTTDSDLASLRNAERDGVNVRGTMIARCLQNPVGQGTGAGARASLSNLMGVPVAQVPQVFCERMTDGTLDGRLSAADLNSPVSGSYSPQLIRVLRGG